MKEIIDIQTKELKSIDDLIENMHTSIDYMIDSLNTLREAREGLIAANRHAKVGNVADVVCSHRKFEKSARLAQSEMAKAVKLLTGANYGN